MMKRCGDCPSAGRRPRLASRRCVSGRCRPPCSTSSGEFASARRCRSAKLQVEVFAWLEEHDATRLFVISRPDVMSLSHRHDELLSRLEQAELALLSWGRVDGTLTESEVLRRRRGRCG